jgi:hypothetical protein
MPNGGDDGDLFKFTGLIDLTHVEREQRLHGCLPEFGSVKLLEIHRQRCDSGHEMVFLRVLARHSPREHSGTLGVFLARARACERVSNHDSPVPGRVSVAYRWSTGGPRNL